MQKYQTENIVLHKVYQRDLKPQIIEIQPEFSESNPVNALSIDSSGNISWCKFPEISFPDFKIPKIPQIIENDQIRGTEIYYKDGKIGISRLPLHTYKFDIAVPKNTIMTAFHVGDGSYGFSMGNGANQGFIPEIIGMGSDENDAGLYFLGRAGNNLKSDIPLIIMDGRNSQNSSLKNRPIFGITSGDYSNYQMIIDHKGRVGIGRNPEIYKMEIEGSIKADDLVLGGLSVKGLIDIIKDHQDEIDNLKDKVKTLSEQK